jgi:GWxTD domain-containing protein
LKRWESTALAALVASAPSAATQGVTRLELNGVRFYRHAGETLVEAFLQVPVGRLSGLARLEGGGAAYRVSVSVRDSAGAQLMAESWTQAVPAEALQQRNASTVEHFRFAAQPGRYTLDVAVTDSASKRVSRTRAEVQTYRAPPRASDLLLASGIRQAAREGDTVPRDGEIRKGSLFLQSSGRPTLTPELSEVGYYLELYPQRSETATVAVRVSGAAGNQVVATAPQPIALDTSGGATRGMVDLAGLPPGEYRLEVAVTTADSVLVRSAAFRMAGFDQEAARSAPAAHDVFAALSERALDSLYDPLIYLMSAEEQGISSSLTVEGKRTFLRRFWAARDPAPATPHNQAMTAFYGAITEANRRFREGGAAQVVGWRTDRGRIFIRYGPPDEVLSRPQAGSSRPYEVWKYARVRARKFVFLDVTSFGHYELIWTDERREPSRPNWRELLGPEAVEDVERF